ncbi:MAG: hypothetical protein ABI597_01810 [Gammaproteobacteria bacterium]
MSTPRRPIQSITEAIRQTTGNETYSQIDSLFKPIFEKYPHLGIDPFDDQGETPAIVAVTHSNPNQETIKWLLNSARQIQRHKTSPNLDHKDKQGKTALIHALSFSDADAEEKESKTQDAKLLEKKKECLKLILKARFPEGSVIAGSSKEEFNLAMETAIQHRNRLFPQLALQWYGEKPDFLLACQQAINFYMPDELKELCKNHLWELKMANDPWYQGECYFLINQCIHAHKNKYIDQAQVMNLLKVLVDDFINPYLNATYKIELNWDLTTIGLYFAYPQYNHLFDCIERFNEAYIARGAIIDYQNQKIALEDALNIVKRFFSFLHLNDSFKLFDPLFALVIQSNDLELVSKLIFKLDAQLSTHLKKLCDMAKKSNNELTFVQPFLAAIDKLFFAKDDFLIGTLSQEIRGALDKFFKYEPLKERPFSNEALLRYLHADNAYLKEQNELLIKQQIQQRESPLIEEKHITSTQQHFSSRPLVKTLFKVKEVKGTDRIVSAKPVRRRQSV